MTTEQFIPQTMTHYDVRMKSKTLKNYSPKQKESIAKKTSSTILAKHNANSGATQWLQKPLRRRNSVEASVSLAGIYLPIYYWPANGEALFCSLASVVVSNTAGGRTGRPAGA